MAPLDPDRAAPARGGGERRLEAAREQRRKAGERLALAWGIAVMPNLLVALGVEFSGRWMIVRYALSAVFLIALTAWLVTVWQVERARRRARRRDG